MAIRSRLRSNGFTILISCGACTKITQPSDFEHEWSEVADHWRMLGNCRNERLTRVKRAILVGAGGFGSRWVNTFLPDFDAQIEIVGVVDIDSDVLNQAATFLGVPADRQFADVERAFANVEADFCILVIQPFLRLSAIRLATQFGLPVLMEKPIADSWAPALEILARSRSTNVPIAVVQNYPHTNRIRTLKRVLDEGSLGPVSHVVARFAADYTAESAGGAFRHQVPYAMIFEGLVHHFDQLRNLTDSDGALIAGHQWNPPWSTFANAPTAMFLVTMANGVACQFEVNHLAKGAQSGWHREYYRVECERGSVELGSDGEVRTVEHLGGGRLRTTAIEPVSDPEEGHHVVIGEFLTWLDGGPPPQSAIDDNIYTAAMTFGAVEAVRTHTVVDVAAMLDRAGLTPVSRRFAPNRAK